MGIKAGMTAIHETFEGARPINGQAVLQQISKMDLLAISGGRATIGYQGVILPVANGYYVTVTLDASDTYTVRRVYKRGDKVWTKGEIRDVYADQISEVAYRASCYEDDFAVV